MTQQNNFYNRALLDLSALIRVVSASIRGNEATKITPQMNADSTQINADKIKLLFSVIILFISALLSAFIRVVICVHPWWRLSVVLTR